jgi:hypothetical protein
MRLPYPTLWFLSCLLLNGAAQAHATGPELPAWQTLELQQQAMWVIAKSQITLTSAPDQPGQWLLSANSSVARNTEEVSLYLQAENGRAISRSRLSRGKNQRFKTYEYTPGYVLRERHEPDSAAQLPASQWPLTSRTKIAYPGELDNRVVTNARALLILAERFRKDSANTAEVAVHTDMNFYLVTMRRGEDTHIEVNYQLANKGEVTGNKTAQTVILQVTQLGEATDKADFSLMGLSSDISLLFDAESGLLLQLRGIAPRIGQTEINLASATLRTPK